METLNMARTGATLTNYLTRAEDHFVFLLEQPDLDRRVAEHPSLAHEFNEALDFAIATAFSDDCPPDDVHLFLQRVLYRINRLKLFWYDDFSRYENERSEYLRRIRDRIESAWQPWEFSQLQVGPINCAEVAAALRQRAARDVAPPISATGAYFRDEVGAAGYRKILEISSLDGLVEASQLSRTLGGVGNEVHAMMTRLLVEEYGGGRLSRKHSSFFRVMLEELEMDIAPEAYLDQVPWEVLATINHSFLLSERKRFYLRYVGGLLYTEVSVPAGFDNYRLAAERLGMSEKARAYWELHIREDERHGRWMLDDVAIPLAQMYPREAAELILGYDQQKFMSDRAGRAVAFAARRADEAESAGRPSDITGPMMGNLALAANAL